MHRPWFVCSWRMAHWCLLDVTFGWVQKRHSAALARRDANDFVEDEEPVEDVVTDILRHYPSGTSFFADATTTSSKWFL